MGVETVWIIDPKTRTGRMCSGMEWVESSRLEVKGTPLYVDLPEIFSQLISARESSRKRIMMEHNFRAAGALR
jgi:hypothetical protein